MLKLARKVRRLVGHAEDPVVLAAAVDARMGFLVTLDREQMLNDAALRNALAFPMGSPGDCLAWFRASD